MSYLHSSVILFYRLFGNMRSGKPSAARHRKKGCSQCEPSATGRRKTFARRPKISYPNGLPVGRVINHDLEEEKEQQHYAEQEEREQQRHAKRQADIETAEHEKQAKWDSQREWEMEHLEEIDAAILACFAPSVEEEEEDSYDYGWNSIEIIPATRLFTHTTSTLVKAVRECENNHYLYSTIKNRAFFLHNEKKLFIRRRYKNIIEWRCVPF